MTLPPSGGGVFFVSVFGWRVWHGWRVNHRLGEDHAKKLLLGFVLTGVKVAGGGRWRAFRCDVRSPFSGVSNCGGYQVFTVAGTVERIIELNT